MGSPQFGPQPRRSRAPAPQTFESQQKLVEEIRIRGARTHDLKNINLDLPRNKLIVITGLSGSVKASLAFDTADAKRDAARDTRQFLRLMEKSANLIEGLSPDAVEL